MGHKTRYNSSGKQKEVVALCVNEKVKEDGGK